MKGEIGDRVIEERLGRVTLSPAGPVVAGSYGQWTLTYTVGSYGVDEGGTVMVVQRIASDWQAPQFERPDQPGYTTIRTNGNARLNARFQSKQHVRPWMKWSLVLDVLDGYLAPGDTVTLVLGDRSKGSPGIRAQSFIESAHEFRFLVDPTNAVLVRRLPSSPKFPVVAGDPVRLVCILPSEKTAGEDAGVFVKAEDRWGNPAAPPGPVSFRIEGSASGRIDGSLVKQLYPGTLYVHASSGGLRCRSNPLTVFERRPVYGKYWGDLHAQTDSTVGTGTEQEYFTFGRDVARLDFIGHQGNDFQVTDQDWTRLNRVIQGFHRPGRYVVFPGYEWSGNTAAGGDHNVIYLEEGQPIFRSSHWQIPEVPEDENSPAHPVDRLYEKLRENKKAIVIPHVGGRFADVRNFFDPELMPVVEIVSCWGEFEWMLWDALEGGHTVGVVCNSDGHKGRPGAEGPGAGDFGIYGGLTCVMAESLTREAIFAALKERRCYGTTGARMWLQFQADGRPMGSVIETGDTVKIDARVKGTGPLEGLYLYSGKDRILSIRPPEFETSANSNRIRIRWQGARIRGRARRATWDGSVSVSGNRILSAKTFAFDSPADGILEQDSERLAFRSRTTGDTDGIDLFLEEPRAGRIEFRSKVGSASVDLSDIRTDSKAFDFGGLDLKLIFQRYPLEIETLDLTLEHTFDPGRSRTHPILHPILIKAVQEDGHTAWSSPIFVKWLSS